MPPLPPAYHRGHALHATLREARSLARYAPLASTRRQLYLSNLPEKKDIAKAIKEAMDAIEKYKPELRGMLPQNEYARLTRNPKTRDLPKKLLKNFADIPRDASGDIFEQIYEYFLAEFARTEAALNMLRAARKIYGVTIW